MFAKWGLALACLFVAAGAAAQTPEWERCSGQRSKSPQDQVAACTAIIREGKETRNDLARAYGNRANGYNEAGEAERSLVDYAKAIELNPKDGYFHSNRGVAYEQLGRFEEAVADHTRAVQMMPEAADALFNRANAYLRWGKYDSAIADYDGALKLDPDYAAAAHNRRIALRRKATQ